MNDVDACFTHPHPHTAHSRGRRERGNNKCNECPKEGERERERGEREVQSQGSLIITEKKVYRGTQKRTAGGSFDVVTLTTIVRTLFF
jgi:hypothetical protein